MEKNEILKHILKAIPETIDKQAGYLPYDLSSGLAIELRKLYDEIDQLKKMVDVDQLEGQALDKYIYQRKGLVRKPASFAQGKLLVFGKGEITKGDLFSTVNGILFKSEESVSLEGSREITISAVEGGIKSNVLAETIIQIPMTIKGITACINPNKMTGGYDAEDDERLRQRYYTVLRLPATSGNIYHYNLWAKEMPGVGEVKVMPLWNGPNTVKVVVVDSRFQPAPDALIQGIQNHIDPGSKGMGAGQAPIGACCTVVSAKAKPLKISCEIKMEKNYTADEIKEKIEANINAYLKQIVFKQNYVSYALIGNAIATTEGVKDLSNVKVNGAMKNIDIEDIECPVIEEIQVIKGEIAND